jgi:hypothetical protein
MALLPVDAGPSDGGLLDVRPATRLRMCRPRVAYSRARWLDGASNTRTLRPTVGRLVANVTASNPLALP